jgi:hypothetical protein
VPLDEQLLAKTSDRFRLLLLSANLVDKLLEMLLLVGFEILLFDGSAVTGKEICDFTLLVLSGLSSGNGDKTLDMWLLLV